MKKAWFDERFFLEVVMVIVKDEKIHQKDNVNKN